MSKYYSKELIKAISQSRNHRFFFEPVSISVVFYYDKIPFPLSAIVTSLRITSDAKSLQNADACVAIVISFGKVEKPWLGVLIPTTFYICI